jgi:hypothetical protein
MPLGRAESQAESHQQPNLPDPIRRIKGARVLGKDSPHLLQAWQ